MDGEKQAEKDLISAPRCDLVVDRTLAFTPYKAPLFREMRRSGVFRA